MAHSHTHSPIPSNSMNRSFVLGIVLNLLFVIIEFISGFYSNSLALLSDAGHNLSDVGMLALSLFALRLSERKSTERYTYGFHRGTILASLANAVILLLVAGSIGWEAILRFIHPVPAQGNVISCVAGIGIVINLCSAFLFFRSKDKELNAKGAYLHLILDAAVSLCVVISGLLIVYTGLEWIDPLISLLVMITVIYSTWGLLKESLRLSLDAVPEGIDVEEVKNEILKMSGIRDIYHIHIWAIGTTRNAMTAHLVVENHLNESEVGKMKDALRHALEHINIQHVTLEIETNKAKVEACEP